MIVCATNLSFTKLNFSNFVKTVNHIGFTNIEVAPFLIDKEPFNKKQILKIKKEIKKQSIRIHTLQSIFYELDYLDLSKNHNNDLIDRFKKIISFAKNFSIKQISIGSIPSRRYLFNKKKLFEINLILFKQLLQIASKSKIILCIEPISHKYKNKFLTNHDEVITFIKKINNKYLKLLLDTGNLDESKQDFKKIFLKYREHIHHIHLSNQNLKNLNLNKIKKYYQILKHHNYNGSFSFEYIANKGIKLNQISKIIKKI